MNASCTAASRWALLPPPRRSVTRPSSPRDRHPPRAPRPSRRATRPAADVVATARRRAPPVAAPHSHDASTFTTAPTTSSGTTRSGASGASSSRSRGPQPTSGEPGERPARLGLLVARHPAGQVEAERGQPRRPPSAVARPRRRAARGAPPRRPAAPGRRRPTAPTRGRTGRSARTAPERGAPRRRRPPAPPGRRAAAAGTASGSRRSSRSRRTACCSSARTLRDVGVPLGVVGPRLGRSTSTRPARAARRRPRRAP